MKDEMPPEGDVEIASGMGMCDFCAPPQPAVWTYACESFVLPVQLVSPAFGNRLQRSNGAWGACEACADLIEKGHKEKLARRAGLLYKMGFQMPLVLKFFEHRIDEPRYKSEQPFLVFEKPLIFPDDGDK